MAVRMHADEVDIDAALVRRLVAARFPRWAGLPVCRVTSSGTDNALYRLGADMAVRLPRTPGATGQVEKDQRWLPGLAAHLPLAVPEPLGVGAPAEGYPWTWGVYRWLDGGEATPDRLADPQVAAADLAGFLRALHGVDTDGGPTPRPDGSGRGGLLARRDESTRAAIGALAGEVDTTRVTRAWEAALAVPAWSGAPVWLHADLTPGNLLAVRGRLSAVIDFACLVVGDPACDLLPAWNLFSGAAREVFRARTGVDDDTWARGRGWALSVALIALPYYLHTNPGIVADSRRVIEQVLA
jgi:aminoglycoside phosphotransferase (APT) family kinase protein